MNRRTIISVAAALLGSGLVSLAGSGASSAEQSDTDKIKAAIDSFHAALTALDSKKMGAVWAHDPDVMVINPRDKSVSIGWDAVSKNWEATFAFWSELKVTQQDGPHIHINGNVAWADGISSVSGKPKTGDAIPSAPTFETDVFEKRGRRLAARLVQRMAGGEVVLRRSRFDDSTCQKVRGNALAGKHARDSFHLVESAKHGRYFITRDERLLKKREALAKLLPNFCIASPTEFLAAYHHHEQARPL